MAKDWQDILKEKEDKIEKRQEGLGLRLSGLKKILLGLILDDVVDGLEVEQGKFVASSGNMAKARRVIIVFDQFSARLQQSGAKKEGFLSYLINGVKQLLALGREYFKKVTGKPVETAYEKAVRLVMLQIGFDVKTNKVIKGSWLDRLLAAEATKLEVIGRLNQAILSGQDLKTFRKSFKDDFINKLSTKSELWGGVTTNTLYATLDRQISEIHRRELGLEFFIFSGPVIMPSQKSKGSREWCLEKKGKIFHASVFEKWDKQVWQGKIIGAPVAIGQGGYNCTDNFAFISNELCADLIKRGRKHELTKEQLELLN